MAEVVGDEVREVRGFLHCRLQHALKAVTVLKIFLQHMNDSTLLLAHDGVQQGHLVFDVFEFGELGV